MKKYLMPDAEIITFGEDVVVTSPVGGMQEDNDFSDGEFTELTGL